MAGARPAADDRPMSTYHTCAGRLLDLLRRLFSFGLSLMKMDLRQESSRHTQALAAVTQCAPCLPAVHPFHTAHSNACSALF